MMAVSNKARYMEIEKYVKVYALHPEYAMGKRITDGMTDLAQLPHDWSYLDVGCGRGEMVAYAKDLGLCAVGVEAVPNLCDGKTIINAQAHDLPFASKSFDASSMFDVLEHLLPDDDVKALEELKRVTRHKIMVTANNTSGVDWGTGDKYHVNIREYFQWDNLIRDVFAGHKITWLKGQRRFSETWHIEL